MPPLAERVRAGERRAVAQALTLVENGAPGAADVLAALTPHLGRAHVVGITGAPGAGKSTLVNALLGALLAAGQKVAVVAVDPSSPITGGAVLGDRVRMGVHGAHPDVFIRSVGSRGALGGVSHSTRRIIDVFDAAGFDTVVVETVGAGQSEVEISRLADTRVVVCPPGLGDAVQALKAGILEIADVLVVSKGDLPAADATVRDLKEMLGLRSGKGAQVRILKTVATRDEGVAELAAVLAAHRAETGAGHRLSAGAPEAGAPEPRVPSSPPRGAPPETACRTPGAAPMPGAARAGIAASGRDHDGDSAAGVRVMALAQRPDFARALGVRCLAGGAGRAVVQMTVDARHLNFNGACHGGMLFTLADAAFGYASNSHGVLAVGIDTHMTFHQAAWAGDVLTATATEVSRSRRIAVYRIDVTRADGALVGAFTGTVYVTGRDNGAPPAVAVRPDPA